MLENILDILKEKSWPPVFYESSSVSNIFFLNCIEVTLELELGLFPKNFLGFSLIKTGECCLIALCCLTFFGKLLPCFVE